MLFAKSLRLRFLAPVVIAATVAALGVAAASWHYGRRWAIGQMHDRFRSIELALEQTSFPLTPAVLETLSMLSGTDWVTLDRDGRWVSSTLGGDLGDQPRTLFEGVKRPGGGGQENAFEIPADLRLGSRRYYMMLAEHPLWHDRDDRAGRVVILFDKEQVDASALRAALLPLATGLSTITLISAIMLLAGSRLIGRLGRLERQVGQIAGGDFESRLTDTPDDEVGRLASAINSMAEQLRVLWRTVNQQQSAKLLHQISGGMAHQLRNTLTGARMAIELHRGNADGDPEEIRVALRQLEIAEDYVTRLLSLTSNDSRSGRPQRIVECLDDVESTHRPIAKHLRVDLECDVAPDLCRHVIADGASFSAALSNLVHNALQAGDHVWVEARLVDRSTARISVSDNGPGIESSISESLFEPFVTSKPEGMGLGLAVVKRTAEQLGGRVAWSRRGDRTEFTLTVHVAEGDPRSSASESSPPSRS